MFSADILNIGKENDMGMPTCGETHKREIELPNQQKVVFEVTSIATHNGAIPQIMVRLRGKTDLAVAEIKSSLNSPNELRHLASMFNNVANRIDQFNEEAQDEYYEED